MRNLKLYFVSFAVVLGFVACQPEDEVKTTLVDFEDVVLVGDTVWNGADLSGEFKTLNSSFKNEYNADWSSWSGFACSSKKDTVMAGFKNQYSVAAGVAFSGSKFGLAYDSASIVISADSIGAFNIKSLYVCNSTYAYLEMKNGGFGKVFTSGDWFKVTIQGYKDNVSKGSVDAYLADFRDGKSILLKSWSKVDLSALGDVNLLTFTLSSTDNGDWGMNTPAYVCIDNVEFTQTIPAK